MHASCIGGRYAPSGCAHVRSLRPFVQCSRWSSLKIPREKRAEGQLQFVLRRGELRAHASSMPGAHTQPGEDLQEERAPNRQSVSEDPPPRARVRSAWSDDQADGPLRGFALDPARIIAKSSQLWGPSPKSHPGTRQDAPGRADPRAVTPSTQENATWPSRRRPAARLRLLLRACTLGFAVPGSRRGTLSMQRSSVRRFPAPPGLHGTRSERQERRGCRRGAEDHRHNLKHAPECPVDAARESLHEAGSRCPTSGKARPKDQDHTPAPDDTTRGEAWTSEPTASAPLPPPSNNTRRTSEA